MNDIFRGASGAVVRVASDIAAKSAPEGPARDRLFAQKELMRRVGMEVFPKVIAYTPAGYIMERLEPLEWTPERMEGGVFQEAVDLLNAYVWGRTRQARFADVCGPEHVAYVQSIAAGYVPWLCDWFLEKYNELRDKTVTVADEVHGDPTAENMMQRAGGDLVLIDPIPATPKVPALVAVDLGKMLQSADGYERVKSPNFPLKYGTHERILGGWRSADRLAARYFHSVHVLRLIPYQPGTHQQTFIDRLSESAGVHT